MGVIKTALEIALEKTESIKSDKGSIDQFNRKQAGKKMANAFLSGDVDLSEELKKIPENQRFSIKQGVFDVLITQITMPAIKDDQVRLEKTGLGLAILIENSKNKKDFTAMFSQLIQLTGQYLQELAHYDQALRQQYTPKLRKKEEELSRRVGREVKIDPMQDPEFIAFYNQNITALKGNYEPIVEQAREEAKRLFEGS